MMNKPNSRTRMSSEQYAGFLKLWLTPASRVPAFTPEVRAYLRWVHEHAPLSAEALRAAGLPAKQAA